MGRPADSSTEVAQQIVELTFGWFGATVRVNPDLTDRARLEPCLSNAWAVQPGDGAAAAKAIQEITALVVHADDYERFLSLARANRQQVDDILALGKRLITERLIPATAGGRVNGG